MNSYNELLEYVARGSFRLVRLGLELMGLDGSLRLTEGGGIQRVLVEGITDRGQLFGRTFNRKGVVREGLLGYT